MKTEEEIRALKANWQADPLWDIEETEGFEEHRAELLAFRLKCQAGWDQAAAYRNERSTMYQVNAAVEAVNDGDNQDAYGNPGDAASVNYMSAIGHGLLAVVAELRRLNENLEGK